MATKSKFRVRASTAAEWASANPILLSAEPGYETDTKFFRIGDGVTPFVELKRYANKDEVDAAVALALTYRNAAEAAATAAATAAANLTPLLLSPVGAVAAVPATLPPPGFIKANGAALLRADFGALWAFAQGSGNLSGTEVGKQSGQFGPGNGTTTFTIPDLRGLTLRAWDDGRGMDAGRAIGSYQADALAEHSHTGSTSSGGSHRHRLNGNQSGPISILGGQSAKVAGHQTGASGETFSDGYNGARHVEDSGIHTHTFETNIAGGSQESRVKSAALLFCIKF